MVFIYFNINYNFNLHYKTNLYFSEYWTSDMVQFQSTSVFWGRVDIRTNSSHRSSKIISRGYLAKVCQGIRYWTLSYDFHSIKRVPFVDDIIRYNYKGKDVQRFASIIPKVEANVKVQPLTCTILRLRCKIKPIFQWDDKYHGSQMQNFWLWVEDPDSDSILYFEMIGVSKKQVCAFIIIIIDFILFSLNVGNSQGGLGNCFYCSCFPTNAQSVLASCYQWHLDGIRLCISYFIEEFDPTRIPSFVYR